jgi:aminopeptidase 2
MEKASTHAMGLLHPEYDMDARFVVKSLYGPAGALIADAKLTSHPVEVPIPTEGTIEQVFDAVAYKKGASCECLLLSFMHN